MLNGKLRLKLKYLKNEVVLEKVKQYTTIPTPEDWDEQELDALFTWSVSPEGYDYWRYTVGGDIALDYFRSLLEAHDWFYQMTDDHKVWERGQSAAMRISHVLTQIESYFPDGKTDVYSKALTEYKSKQQLVLKAIGYGS